MEFVILIPSYNNEKYVLRNLESIVCQRSSKPFQIIYVNDGSSDRTGSLIDEFTEKHKSPETLIHIIHNQTRVGSALENIYNVVHSQIPDHKIVVCVDGDDRLSFNGVLDRLEKEYSDPDVWMTFGRFVVSPRYEFWPECAGYPEEVIFQRGFRHSNNVPSHLKTFRASLFKKIRRTDLLDPSGQVYRKAWDMAMLFPMLEMCAPMNASSKNHSRYIADTILYVYNSENLLSDFRTPEGRAEQIRFDRYIRSLPPYEPLDHL
jgi:glycosyltransferase involved in cell wall biosynthesis